jgi:thioredoxin 2
MATFHSDARGVLIPCSECEAPNRIPWDRVHEGPRCGRCKAYLQGIGQPVVLPDEETFVAATASGSLPLVVDFWADWCAPCRTLAPTLEALAADLEGEVVFAKLDTEAVPGPGRALGLRSIPTLALYRAGELLGQQAGAHPATTIRQWLRAAGGLDG